MINVYFNDMSDRFGQVRTFNKWTWKVLFI